MSFDSTRSGNSVSNSKRSFNSISSNPSNKASSSGAKSTKNDKKKKNTNQKTLGMAWGANSRSSSRSAFRNSPFSDFGSYMVLKNKKLREQFDAEASSSSQSGSASGKSIFHGVSIFVDGYTVPSSQELRGYMLKYGGRFENYFSRHRVTHIICSNLPDSKIKNLRSFSGGLPVVKPTWVQDSVAANKLLSWIPYQLQQLASEVHNQPKLSAFFPLKNVQDSDDVAPNLGNQVISETKNSSLEDRALMVANCPEQCDSTEQVDQCSPEFDGLLHVGPTEMILEMPACSVGSHCEPKGAELYDISRLDRINTGFEPKSSSSCQASASVCSGIPDDHNFKESSSSRISLASNQPHSTLVDPDFVENYFKNSRLHFIGTWRNRYRKRFHSSSDGFRDKSSCLNASAVVHKTAIIHVDMDCFFVAVVIKNHPELQDKPVAVCHSDSPRGTAEISSANYPARDYGIKAGMFVKDAKARCPHLVIVHYDFGAYEKVADQFYDILHKHCNKVQAVSCDEAFLDVTNSRVEDPQLLASVIRKEILDTTGCTASAGIAENMLMARLATKTAKPDGQCYISPEKLSFQVNDYLCELPVRVLPGIGHVLAEKLKKRQIETCGRLHVISKESLQKEFGVKTGDMLWNYSRGIDNRHVGVIKESKSIGAEVNWGVRFRNTNDTQRFLTNLCKEVSLRLQGCGVLGRSFTLKIKKRRSDAGEPIKYMGHGDCENLSHSITIPMATDELDVLQRITTKLFGYFQIDVEDIRGMGLQVSKLENTDNVHQRNSILSWLVSTSTKDREQEKFTNHTKHNDIVGELNCEGDRGQLCSNHAGPSVRSDAGLSAGVSGSRQGVILPPLHDLDVGVIVSLPPDVIAEINDMYGGELTSFISKYKSDMNMPAMSVDSFEGVTAEEKECHPSYLVQSNKFPFDIKYGDEETPIRPFSAPVSENIAVMPSSLSQVDHSVLQQLPQDLREDILEFLPAHRRLESVPDALLNPSENQTGSPQFVSTNELWVGNPPLWVDKFKLSCCGMLNLFAEMYYRSGHTCHLSSILQRLFCEQRVPLDVGTNEWDDAVSCLCELVKQYLELKIQTDIEEVYVCIRLLRRLNERSKLFGLVCDSILPHLQASFGENYGGTLNVSSVKD
ncbi:DNA repair protein REV1 isoform X4 [Olea europaea var. sylvestris]|uniref:DNA repair protein REV1 isoform X3 n=1 Tax=Olea europaea var. sylvestris TaxID=158386 RepID=UPI000C1D11B2|nr:DNA repair protein REV1 isoform X3 [Olea europaea var. sylvestris]XP_022898471.1 DNA repair protein REV1 isoform X4 [Olea europaea var. sylvestris]